MNLAPENAMNNRTQVIEHMTVKKQRSSLYKMNTYFSLLSNISAKKE